MFSVFDKVHVPTTTYSYDHDLYNVEKKYGRDLSAQLAAEAVAP